jgi:KDO2-lipid IV(A) lauroyltransferase
VNAVELGYAAGWRLIRAMPRSWSWFLFRIAADRAARRKGPATARFERNLRRVVGPDVPPAEMDILVRDGLRSYARYWLDAFRLPRITKQEVLRDFQIERSYLLADAVAAGTGCVVALPHAGNWDYAGAWVAAKGWKLTTVAERLKPEGLYQRFLAFRTSLGMEILPMTGGARPAFDVLVDRLGEGAVVPLLADRDLSARGVEVEFFGGRTRMPAGPALLAIRTGAPLFAASLWYERDRPHCYLFGPLEVPPAESGNLEFRVRALTQTVADRLAEGIAAHPADWHMLQRLWLDEPPGQSGAAVSVPVQEALRASQPPALGPVNPVPVTAAAVGQPDDNSPPDGPPASAGPR